MPKRTPPLELILRPHGTAELVNAHDEQLWASDDDPDFTDEFSDEFLNEEDFDDILEYLVDNDIISEKEYDHFDREEWDCTVESLSEEESDDMENPNPEPDDGDEEDEEES